MGAAAGISPEALDVLKDLKMAFFSDTGDGRAPFMVLVVQVQLTAS